MRSTLTKYTHPSRARHRTGCSTHKTQSRLLQEDLSGQAGITLASPTPMTMTTTYLAASTQVSLIWLASRKRDSTSTNHAGEATFQPRTLFCTVTGQSESARFDWSTFSRRVMKLNSSLTGSLRGDARRSLLPTVSGGTTSYTSLERSKFLFIRMESNGRRIPSSLRAKLQV